MKTTSPSQTLVMSMALGRRRPDRSAPGRLDIPFELDILSDMRKITAREFQKRFGQIAQSMREGQTLEVTMHGKSIGRFTRNRTRRMRLPDFVSLLEQQSCPKELGNQILKEFHDSLS